MNDQRQTKISKFLSLILRHEPEKVGLKLEPDGWANVAELLAACARHGITFTREELRQVVAENDKQRFAFDASGEKIRANQGHSVAVQIEFEKRPPPARLYHGTAARSVESILEKGLVKQSRHHVHLSVDRETARRVGARYGKPVILAVDARAMVAADFEFFVSANEVWLIETVPPQFLEVVET